MATQTSAAAHETYSTLEIPIGTLWLVQVVPPSVLTMTFPTGTDPEASDPPPAMQKVVVGHDTELTHDDGRGTTFQVAPPSPVTRARPVAAGPGGSRAVTTHDAELEHDADDAIETCDGMDVADQVAPPLLLASRVDCVPPPHPPGGQTKPAAMHVEPEQEAPARTTWSSPPGNGAGVQ